MFISANTILIIILKCLLFSKIGNKRKEACRSDLSPIEILNKKEQEELVKFVFDNSKLFSKQNRNNTIDKYFIDRKSCGERSCR